MGFIELTKVDEALRKYLKELDIKRLETEKTKIEKALGRVLGEDVKSKIDVPQCDKSAVDGYALKSEDTSGASHTSPTIIDVIGIVEMGQIPNINLGKLQAVRIATGASLPRGADSVVMLEHTELIDEGKIEIYRSITPGHNVSLRGEDIKKNEKVLSRGTVLQPHDIAILGAIGAAQVGVVSRPKAAILSTGDELVEPGVKVDVNRTVDVNRLFVSAAVKDTGGEPLDLGIAMDEAEDIRSKISKGLIEADLVLVSGGTSVGQRDIVPEVVNSFGSPGVIVHGVSMRPGKPTALASINGKPIILLPGYPVAAMMAFNTFVKPVMAIMLGASVGTERVIRAKMMRRIASSPGFRDFVRVVVKKIGGEYFAHPIRTRGAGIISSIVKADGLIVIPDDKEGVEEGEEVEVALLRTMEE